jgi:TonB family protein
MSSSWLIGNLAAYSMQVALVVVVADLTAAALRLKSPRVKLAYWQAVLAACVVLPLLEPWQPISMGAVGGSATAVGGGATRPDSLVGSWSGHSMLFAVLLAGVGVGLLRIALGLWRLRRYRRAAVRLDPLPGALREVQALVNVAPAFYFTDQVESPLTFGWLYPAVMLPRRFERMEESRQKAIACHELLHIARHDWPMNLLEEVILSLFWFHPAFWWVTRNIRLAREQVVDSQVVALTGARKPYLRALLEMAAGLRTKMLTAPLFLIKSQLAQRFALLRKEIRTSKSRLIGSLVIAISVLMGTGWWAAKTFYLIAPMESSREGIAYGFSSGESRSGLPSTFASCMYVEDEGRAGFWLLHIGRAPIKGPVPISIPVPPYTPQARKDKLAGAIVALADVDAGGKVLSVKITNVSLSSPASDGLEQSVLDTVRTWKFRPATRKGQAVPVTVHVQVTFLGSGEL